MYAVVNIAGTQVKVTPSARIIVPKLKSDVGAKLKFDEVLLVGDEKETKLGKPLVKGSYVEAKVLRHMKDETVIVFKKKKRKGYRVRKGHRQQFTEIEITNLV